MKIKIFDHLGNLIDEIEAEVSERDFPHEISRCKITVSVDDPKCTAENLKFGNQVTIGSDSGIILTPRTWNESTVESTVYFIGIDEYRKRMGIQPLPDFNTPPDEEIRPKK